MRFPFLTTFDPPGSSEGTIDPLGLYILADQLAGELVPGIRERMQRVRFLTAMVVGAVVTEGLEPNPEFPQTPPFLVWEWLIVEAIVRTLPMSEGQLWGIPGSQLVNNSVDQFKYLDERGYLANPRVIGFHGVYKRLAVKLGLLDTALKLRPGRSDELIAAWAAGMEISRFGPDSELFRKWRRAVEGSLESHPPRTRPAGWRKEDWQELAEAFAPHAIPSREKGFLRKLLRRAGDDQLGALTAIWQATETLPDDCDERSVHQALKSNSPEFGVLLEAIAAYEVFSRNLTDAFNMLLASESSHDLRGVSLSEFAQEARVADLARTIHLHHLEATRRLDDLQAIYSNRFQDRFRLFGEPLPAEEFVRRICEHHEMVQRAKSREGKRTWFDRIGSERIYIRPNYRLSPLPPASHRYVHEYRTNPIRRFRGDLT